MSVSRVFFQITPLIAAHRFQIEMSFQLPAAAKLTFSLPVWIPGSYMRRDFASHLSNLNAVDGDGNNLTLEFVDLTTWCSAKTVAAGKYFITYQIYSYDLSVRGCYLDQERALFNPCAACLQLQNGKRAKYDLHFDLTALKNWQVVGARQNAQQYFEFEDYDHLIDTPFLLSTQLQQLSFNCNGITHHIAISGKVWEFATARLTEDVAAICAQALQVFGDFPAHVDSYYFLLHLSANNFGGLEHRGSSLLIAPRALLPNVNAIQNLQYARLLGLFSHEYFHLWNVKHLIPRDFQPYRLNCEQPTTMLWFFEGFTAFFDNWLLLRAHVIEIDEYLTLLAEDINAYWQRKGRLVQTLAQSSYQAWIKFYRRGEDAHNSSTNYYVHGALFAFCLDVKLRELSDDNVDIIILIRYLWQKFARDNLGLDTAAVGAALRQLLPPDAAQQAISLLTHSINSHQLLPLEWSLQQLALTLTTTNNKSPENFALTSEPCFRWQRRGAEFLVTQLQVDAACAGLAVGDQLIAVNNFAVNEQILTRFLRAATPQTTAHLHVVRDGLLQEFDILLKAIVDEDYAICRNNNCGAKENQRFLQWSNATSDTRNIAADSKITRNNNI